MDKTIFRKTLFATLIVTLTYASVGTGVYFTALYRMQEFFSYRFLDYSAEVFCYTVQSLGMISCAFLIKCKPKLCGSRFLFPAVILFMSLLSFFIFAFHNSFLVLLCFFIISFLIGFCQAMYFLLLTVTVPRSYRCLVFGIAYAAATVINAIISLFDGGNFVRGMGAVILYFIMSLPVIALWYFASPLNLSGNHIELANSNAESEPNRSKSVKEASRHDSLPVKKSVFYITLIFIALAWAVQSIGFYFPLAHSAVLGLSNEVLRLTYSLGLIIAGFVNSRDKKIGSICCLVTLAAPMLYILLQAKMGISIVVFLLSYFFTGFLAVYRFGIVADLAEGKDSKGRSLLYLCSFGLVFGRLGEAFGAFIGIVHSDDPLMLMTITSAVLVVGVVFYVLHYQKLFLPVPQSVKTRDDILTSIRIKYELSSREIDVLNLLVDGATNAEIADQLFISENTVRFHVSNLLKKTECKNRKELTALFLSLTSGISG